MKLLRLLYTPLGIVAGLIAGRVGKSVFQNVWSRIDDGPPPLPRTGEGSTVKVAGGQALQAAVMAGSAAIVERLFSSFFHYLVGAWPKKAPEPESSDS